jgi:hypothetical protein
MVGGVIGFVLYMTRGNPFWATLAAVIAVGAIGGAILLKVAVEPSLRQRNAYGWILATLAVASSSATRPRSSGAPTTSSVRFPSG